MSDLSEEHLGQNLCPVSDRIITEKPEWRMGTNADPYHVRFQMIGDDILYVMPSGSATVESTEHSLRINTMVEKEILLKKPLYVLIENFSNLLDFTLDARLRYIRHFRGRQAIAGLIFFGVSYLTSLSIRIAAKMYLAHFPVKVVASYEEAVTLALEMLHCDRKERKLSSPVHGDPVSRLQRGNGKPHDLHIQSDPLWIIQTEGYSARYEILNQHILHSVSQGFFGDREAELVMEMQERLFSLLDHKAHIPFMVADISGVTGLSFHTRAMYTKAQKSFYARHKFEALIFYGGSRILNAAIKFERSFVPFKTVLAGSLSESLDIIYSKSKFGDPLEIQGQSKAFDFQKSIDAYSSDVLRYLGTLNLDVDMHPREKLVFEKDHPFQAVFDTIDLINNDLNELTSQRKAEEKRRRELERSLAQSEKMEALGRLSGGVAHDFNNILAGMIGYCDLARYHIHDPDIVLDKIKQIQKGAKRAADLVRQILLFSRKVSYEKTVHEFGQVVKEAMKLLRPAIPSNITIIESIGTEGMVLADQAKMHQIVMNLCTNAVQAMQKSGGTLSVSLTEQVIENSDAAAMEVKAGRYLRLDVSDTGQGMDKETLGKVFEPYFTTKEIGKGTGMGLALVYSIVEEHLGHIKIQSSPGKGSLFSVYLPESGLAEKQENKQIRDKKPSKGQERIMVVDDEASILDSTAELLKDAGYQVSAYCNPIKAFEDYKQNPSDFDLVVTDMTMPGMTGDVLAKKMLQINPSIPVILCSGYTDRLSEVDASESGIRKFLQKPIISQPLAEVIREVVDI